MAEKVDRYAGVIDCEDTSSRERYYRARSKELEDSIYSLCSKLQNKSRNTKLKVHELTMEDIFNEGDAVPLIRELAKCESELEKLVKGDK